MSSYTEEGIFKFLAAIRIENVAGNQNTTVADADVNIGCEAEEKRIGKDPEVCFIDDYNVDHIKDLHDEEPKNASQHSVQAAKQKNNELGPESEFRERPTEIASKDEPCGTKEDSVCREKTTGSNVMSSIVKDYSSDVDVCTEESIDCLEETAKLQNMENATGVIHTENNATQDGENSSAGNTLCQVEVRDILSSNVRNVKPPVNQNKWTSKACLDEDTVSCDRSVLCGAIQREMLAAPAVNPDIPLRIILRRDSYRKEGDGEIEKTRQTNLEGSSKFYFEPRFGETVSKMYAWRHIHYHRALLGRKRKLLESSRMEFCWENICGFSPNRLDSCHSTEVTNKLHTYEARVEQCKRRRHSDEVAAAMRYAKQTAPVNVTLKKGKDEHVSGGGRKPQSHPNALTDEQVAQIIAARAKMGLNCPRSGLLFDQQQAGQTTFLKPAPPLEATVVPFVGGKSVKEKLGRKQFAKKKKSKKSKALISSKSIKKKTSGDKLVVGVKEKSTIISKKELITAKKQSIIIDKEELTAPNKEKPISTGKKESSLSVAVEKLKSAAKEELIKTSRKSSNTNLDPKMQTSQLRKGIAKTNDTQRDIWSSTSMRTVRNDQQQQQRNVSSGNCAVSTASFVGDAGYGTAANVYPSFMSAQEYKTATTKDGARAACFENGFLALNIKQEVVDDDCNDYYDGEPWLSTQGMATHECSEAETGDGTPFVNKTFGQMTSDYGQSWPFEEQSTLEHSLSCREKEAPPYQREAMPNQIQRISDLGASSSDQRPYLASLEQSLTCQEQTATEVEGTTQACYSRDALRKQVPEQATTITLPKMHQAVSDLFGEISEYFERRCDPSRDYVSCDRCGLVYRSSKDLARHFLHHLVDEATTGDAIRIAGSETIASFGDVVAESDKIVDGSGETVTGSSETVSRLSKTVGGSGETVTGSSETVSELGETFTGSDKSISESGETVGGSGETVTGSSETVSGIGETIGGSGETVIGSSETVIGSGETVLGLGDAVTGSGESASELGETVGGATETVTGLTQTVSGLGQSVTGSGEGVSRPGKTVGGSSQTVTCSDETASGADPVCPEVHPCSSDLSTPAKRPCSPSNNKDGLKTGPSFERQFLDSTSSMNKEVSTRWDVKDTDEPSKVFHLTNVRQNEKNAEKNTGRPSIRTCSKTANTTGSKWTLINLNNPTRPVIWKCLSCKRKFNRIYEAKAHFDKCNKKGGP
eukprot:gene18097-19906_t